MGSAGRHGERPCFSHREGQRIRHLPSHLQWRDRLRSEGGRYHKRTPIREADGSYGIDKRGTAHHVRGILCPCRSSGEAPTDIASIALAMLTHPNGASKDPFIRHYDKTVIGNSWIEAGKRTLVFFCRSGILRVTPWTACIRMESQGRRPFCRHCIRGRRQRSVRTNLGVRAGKKRRRGSDVQCRGGGRRSARAHGLPQLRQSRDPPHLGALEDGVRGIADAAKAMTFESEPVPIISGNVSLYNSLPDGSAIDPTAIVSAIGVLKDGRKAVNARFKNRDRNYISSDSAEMNAAVLSTIRFLRS